LSDGEKTKELQKIVKTQRLKSQGKTVIGSGLQQALGLTGVYGKNEATRFFKIDQSLNKL